MSPTCPPFQLLLLQNKPPQSLEVCITVLLRCRGSAQQGQGMEARARSLSR